MYAMTSFLYFPSMCGTVLEVSLLKLNALEKTKLSQLIPAVIIPDILLFRIPLSASEAESLRSSHHY